MGHDAGELAWVAVGVGVEFELAQSFQAAREDLGGAEISGLLQRQSYIFQRGERVEESVALKQKTAAAAELGTRGRDIGI